MLFIMGHAGFISSTVLHLGSHFTWGSGVLVSVSQVLCKTILHQTGNPSVPTSLLGVLIGVVEAAYFPALRGAELPCCRYRVLPCDVFA